MYFNPRSYKRSDLLRHDLLWELLLFQSTLLQEERLCLFPEIFQLSSISIHAPTRGATFIVVSAVPARIISIHAPTRGATILVRMFLLNYIFQSTLLQEERLIWLPNSNRCRNFNPRSYKRSDTAAFDDLNVLQKFQSTLLQEERQFSYLFILGLLNISIHAPTRGATQRVKGIHWPQQNFNPRSYKRSDGKNAQLSLYLSVIIIA